MTEFGEPITTEQCTWAILKEIKSPVVGDLTTYSAPSYAFDYIFKNDNQVFNMLSGGERRLVNIAFGIHSMREDASNSGIAALGGLDRTLRRKVWLYIGYLYLGRDVAKDWNEWNIDFDAVKGAR